MKKISLSFAAALALFALGGCAEAKKQAECKSLIGAIGPHSTKIAKLADSMTDATPLDVGEKTFLAMSAESEAAAAEVKALAVETPELKKFADDYQTMCAASSKAFKDMIAVAKKVDDAQKSAATNPQAAQAELTKAQADATAADAEMKKAVAPEDGIVDGINKACGAK